MQNTKTNNLLSGNIFKSLLALAVPIIFANILQTAYQITDTFWVGRLGAEAVAAVSLSFPLLFLVISFGGGLAMAGTILAAQYKGQNNQKMIDFISGQTMSIVVMVSIVLSLLGYFISPLLVRIMGAAPEVMPQAISYLQISFLGMVFVFGTAVFQSLLRGVGDVKTPMYIILSTVILNLFLDPLFILGFGPIPGFGVTGAAIATIGTQAIATIIGLFILFAGKHDIHLRLKNLKPSKNTILKIFKIGLPASIEQSMRAFGMAVMTFLVASFGTTVLAAYGIGGRIFSFIIIPALGLSMATSTLVSQNIGANQMSRAEKITKQSAWFGFWSLSLVGLIMFFLAKPLSGIFVPGELEVIHLSALFIKIIAFTFGLMAVQQILTGTLRGAGDTMSAMILSIVSFWVLQFPLALILSKFTDLAEFGLWLAFPIANILSTIITIWWYRRGKWKNKKITEEDKLTEKTFEETMIEEAN
ncbi:MATE family efflux transporter [Candidatus Nomurabacteria bacterium]|nr:MATE family efflux transporter [Candidatus Nomurabacteria bacterium]